MCKFIKSERILVKDINSQFSILMKSRKNEDHSKLVTYDIKSILDSSDGRL